MAEKKKLGEMLIEAGLIDNIQLQAALGHQRQWSGKLGEIILEMGFITEHTLADFFETHLNIPCLDLSDFEVPENIKGLLKDDLIRKYNVVPIAYEKGLLTIAMTDPSDIKVIDELQFATGNKIRPILVFSQDAKRLIQKYFGEEVVEVQRQKINVQAIKEGKDFEIIRDEGRAALPAKKEVTIKNYLDALTKLLIGKGLITKDELQEKIKEEIK